MAPIRYVEAAPIDASSTAIRTFSGHWFTVPVKIDQALDAVGSLASPDGQAPASATRERLLTLLTEGGSVGPARTSHGRTEASPVLMIGEGQLFSDVRRGGPVFSNAPAATAKTYDPGLMRAAVALVVSPGFADDGLSEVGTALTDASQPWLPFVISEGRGWLGPMFGPPGGLCLDDLLGRLAANAVAWPGLDSPDTRAIGSWQGAGHPAVAWMAATAAADLTRYAAGEPSLAQGHLLEMNPATLSVSRHPVLPLPFGRAVPDRADPVDAAPAALLDERTGIITRTSRFQHHPAIPKTLISVHAHVSKMRRVGPWQTDSTTAGTSFVSEEAARHAAIGEAVERYCGNIVQPGLLCEATWRELAERGEHAVDPDDLILFSAKQYATQGFPFVPFTRDLRVFWVRGRSLTRDCAAWIPASIAYPNWRNGGFEQTAPLANAYFAGLAAGPHLEFAIVSGIQEIVERHITMAWWANACPLSAIRTIPASLQALWSGAPERAGQRGWLISLPNEFDIPVIAGVVEHVKERLLTIGFAARSDPEQAAFKAWAEALTLQDGARNLNVREGGYRQAAARGDVSADYVKPWRADRRYLDDYRSDFRDVVDLMCQLQIALDPRTADRIRPWVDTTREGSLTDIRPLADNSLRTYAAAIEAAGFEIFYADLTTRDVSLTGMRAVRVMVPGLIGNFAAAFPFQGGGRLRDVAVELGWRPRALDEENINVFPMPHA